jgi:hypothetical protein
MGEKVYVLIHGYKYMAILFPHQKNTYKNKFVYMDYSSYLCDGALYFPLVLGDNFIV